MCYCANTSESKRTLNLQGRGFWTRNILFFLSELYWPIMFEQALVVCRRLSVTTHRSWWRRATSPEPSNQWATCWPESLHVCSSCLTRTKIPNEQVQECRQLLHYDVCDWSLTLWHHSIDAAVFYCWSCCRFLCEFFWCYICWYSAGEKGFTDVWKSVWTSRDMKRCSVCVLCWGMRTTSTSQCPVRDWETLPTTCSSMFSSTGKTTLKHTWRENQTPGEKTSWSLLHLYLLFQNKVFRMFS